MPIGLFLKLFWLAGAPATLTAVALAAQETNRPPFGARRSRKLARLQVENLPLQCFESNMPHLPAEELEIAIQDLCSRRLLMLNLHTLCSLLPYKEQMKWGIESQRDPKQDRAEQKNAALFSQGKL
ncbi:MAU2 chromatid cohesion factor [Platysternon megacephalum]|uniref:MAU2 chromatid cohesion factor n=1 Tax=Platysternon megacephalum TaxID=55544 RepID=A0A4D9E8F4_9SAUR|nr:MAU2 chromatid cohesion factor [Platysternon megacephalum]